MVNVLFVGGPKDRSATQIQENKVLVFKYLKNGLPMGPLFGGERPEPEPCDYLEQHCYIPTGIYTRDARGEWRIYKHEELDECEVLHKLMASYHEYI